MSSVDLSRLTAIVQTSNQPRSIERLVRSVRRWRPQLRLLVADDSRQPRPIDGADWVRLPADVGVSAARNSALARVRTPYFLLLEEDHELTRRSGVESLLDLVAHSRVDIAAGDCLRQGRRFGLFPVRTPELAHATFEFAGDGLTLRAGHRLGVDGFHAVDLAANFFVARTDKVRSMGGWDPQLLVDERIEFFVRAQRFGLRVGLRPESIVVRRPRGRGAGGPGNARDFGALALAKMGVLRLVDVEGRVRTAPPRVGAA